MSATLVASDGPAGTLTCALPLPLSLHAVNASPNPNPSQPLNMEHSKPMQMDIDTSMNAAEERKEAPTVTNTSSDSMLPHVSTTSPHATSCPTIPPPADSTGTMSNPFHVHTDVTASDATMQSSTTSSHPAAPSSQLTATSQSVSAASSQTIVTAVAPSPSPVPAVPSLSQSNPNVVSSSQPMQIDTLNAAAEAAVSISPLPSPPPSDSSSLYPSPLPSPSSSMQTAMNPSVAIKTEAECEPNTSFPASSSSSPSKSDGDMDGDGDGSVSGESENGGHDGEETKPETEQVRYPLDDRCTLKVRWCYRAVTFLTDLFFGVDKELDHLPEKRKVIQVHPEKQVKSGVEHLHEGYVSLLPPDISAGYGELSWQGFDKLLYYMQHRAPMDVRLDATSRFLDIGSGFGKCVFHAKVRAGVAKSVGIECIKTRHEKALESLHLLRAGFVPGLSDQKDAPSYEEVRDLDLANCELIEGDVSQPMWHHLVREATHIYAFDVVFSKETHARILPVVEASNFTMFATYLSPRKLAQFGCQYFELMHGISVRTTGRQSFTCYFYRKSAVPILPPPLPNPSSRLSSTDNLAAAAAGHEGSDGHVTLNPPRRKKRRSNSMRFGHKKKSRSSNEGTPTAQGGKDDAAGTESDHSEGGDGHSSAKKKAHTPSSSASRPRKKFDATPTVVYSVRAQLKMLAEAEAREKAEEEARLKAQADAEAAAERAKAEAESQAQLAQNHASSSSSQPAISSMQSPVPSSSSSSPHLSAPVDSHSSSHPSNSHHHAPTTNGTVTADSTAVPIKKKRGPRGPYKKRRKPEDEANANGDGDATKKKEKNKKNGTADASSEKSKKSKKTQQHDVSNVDASSTSKPRRSYVRHAADSSYLTRTFKPRTTNSSLSAKLDPIVVAALPKELSHYLTDAPTSRQWKEKEVIIDERTSIQLPPVAIDHEAYRSAGGATMHGTTAPVGQTVASATPLTSPVANGSIQPVMNGVTAHAALPPANSLVQPNIMMITKPPNTMNGHGAHSPH